MVVGLIDVGLTTSIYSSIIDEVFKKFGDWLLSLPLSTN